MTASIALTDPMLRRRRREQHSDLRSQAFLRALRIPGHGRCWEVGAGLGSMARWLATTVVPDGEVFATERRAEHVDHIAADALDNLHALHHDVEVDEPLRGEFDLIYARFVFEHLVQRDRILGVLARRLRPDGWLVIEDAVIDRQTGIAPPAFARALRDFAARKPASNYLWARELPSRMRAAGLSGVRAQHVRDVFASGTDLARFWASVLLQEAGRADDAAPIASELVSGRRWFHGPVVVQAAGRREP